MKTFYKNPFFYYLLIPVLIGIWPVLLWSKYIPEKTGQLEKWTAYYVDANDQMRQILELDPDRLENTMTKDGKVVQFDYYSAIHRAAKVCGVPSRNVELNTGMMTTGKQVSQTANVTLRDLNITACARFLSSLTIQWPNLQCTDITLEGKKDANDQWDLKLKLKYFYKAD